MLDDELKTQLKAYLERLERPIELVAVVDDSQPSREMLALLDDIAAQSTRVGVVHATATDGERVPSFQIREADARTGRVRFAGLPLGHEFSSLVLALLQVGGYPPKVESDLIDRIRALDQDLDFETFLSLSCQNCPDVVQALNLMSALNPRIRHVSIDGASFRQEAESRQILAVPAVFLNGQPFGQGRMTLADILDKLDTQSGGEGARRLAAHLSERAPYEVLIVGGGPAGAAAALYAARKGIRVGMIAERFGGQVQDTLGIDNYPSVLHTEGPQFAAQLERQVQANEVELITNQTVQALQPAAAAGGLANLRLASGATLRARTVILAPGARWRQVGCPGEDEYRNRGVAYCPHCDGPLFKGKPVAVIGGGNSGVEAAIDLAGIASKVTLLEFAEKLRADAVLVRKLESLSNVVVHTRAETTAILGDDAKVSSLRWNDRDQGSSHTVEVDGIFVQIGLVPNTDWLSGAVALTPFGEIEIDARGRTNRPGIFAAGDATTVPFKQIVIAAGDGAKAALSAFDFLIRHAPAEADAVEAAREVTEVEA